AVAVINADDEFVRAMPREGQNVIDFSLRAQSSAQYSTKASGAGVELTRHGVPLISMSKLK
ncbi:MAG TPA: hypothetical protein VET48_06350, partial [Steroidobacteraceae bacterium]|nr:hypothetical protein [Steroidobacteraceae bacterium]